MAIAGVPAGTAAIGAGSSGATAQPEAVNAEAPELVAGVAADQLAGTDNPPTVDAWPKPATTGAPPTAAAPGGPAAPVKPVTAKPLATVCALVAKGTVAEAPFMAWLSNTEFGMVFMTHQAVLFTNPLMVFATIGYPRMGVAWAGTAATGEASAATALGKLEIVCISSACAPAAPAWATAAAWPASAAGLAVGAGGVNGLNVAALAEEAA